MGQTTHRATMFLTYSALKGDRGECRRNAASPRDGWLYLVLAVLANVENSLSITLIWP